MKQKIFNRGKGWYISASNYKDQNDKAYLNLFFPKNTEPLYQDNGRGFSVKDIDIDQAKFTSYQGKLGMTIFAYTEISTDEFEPDDEATLTIRKQQTNDGISFTVEPEDLPFY